MDSRGLSKAATAVKKEHPHPNRASHVGFVERVTTIALLFSGEGRYIAEDTRPIRGTEEPKDTPMTHLTRRTFAAGLAAGVATPALGGVAQAQGATLKIGMVIPVTGNLSESGKYALNGAKLALEEINKAGGILGKQVEIVTEDDQSTNPGAVLGFSKLTSNAEMYAFIGPIRSTQIHAIAPNVLTTAKPVLIGGTDPELTKLGNPWLFRFRPNDSYSARVISEYGVTTLGKKKWAVIHATDAFGNSGAKALSESLTKLGITPVLVQGYASNTPDFTPVVLAIKQSGADVIGTYMTNEPDVAVFARQLKQLGINIPWVGSPSVVGATVTKLGGAALNGVYGIADFAEESAPEAKAYADAYRAAYKASPDFFSAWTYDALKVLASATNKAGATDPQKVRTAILGIKGLKGAEGEYNFDEKGDGLHGYNIVKNDGGKIVFDKHIEFKD